MDDLAAAVEELVDDFAGHGGGWVLAQQGFGAWDRGLVVFVQLEPGI